MTRGIRVFSIAPGAAPRRIRRALGSRLVRAAPVAMVAAAALSPVAAALAKPAHVVAPGETLSSISQMYGVSIAQLEALNGISNPNLIYAGETIVVSGASATETTPASSTSEAPAVTYTVQPGDSLSAIAAIYNLSVGAIAQANGISDPNSIYAGQVLQIPAVQLDQVVSTSQEEAILRQAETQFGLPRGLLLALGWMESGFQQGIVSSAGAIGLLQLLPDTAAWAIQQFDPAATNWRTSAADNAALGAATLAFYLHFFGGNETLALAAYYQGLRSVVTSGLYPETQQYVSDILALVAQFQ